MLAFVQTLGKGNHGGGKIAGNLETEGKSKYTAELFRGPLSDRRPPGKKSAEVKKQHGEKRAKGTGTEAVLKEARINYLGKVQEEQEKSQAESRAEIRPGATDLKGR